MRSRCGPVSTAFQFQDTFDLHSVKPSWCLLVNTKYLPIINYRQNAASLAQLHEKQQNIYFAPAFDKRSANSSGSKNSALNIGAKSA